MPDPCLAARASLVGTTVIIPSLALGEVKSPVTGVTLTRS